MRRTTKRTRKYITRQKMGHSSSPFIGYMHRDHRTKKKKRKQDFVKRDHEIKKYEAKKIKEQIDGLEEGV